MSHKQLGSAYARADDCKRLAKLVKKAQGHLWEFFDGERRACEMEIMVAQTICAAVINQKNHGESFSFRGDGIRSYQGGGLADNATAYDKLLAQGWLTEDSWTIKGNERIVIFPTQKLIDRLDLHFLKS